MKLVRINLLGKYTGDAQKKLAGRKIKRFEHEVRSFAAWHFKCTPHVKVFFGEDIRYSSQEVPSAVRVKTAVIEITVLDNNKILKDIKDGIIQNQVFHDLGQKPLIQVIHLED